MIFPNRKEAGILLTRVLKDYKNKDAVVYALPRGGVPVGREIAKALKIPLDLAITRKIGHPYNSEYAVCAVAEGGDLICNPLEESELDSAWLKREEKIAQKEILRRKKKYLGEREHLSPEGKIAIIVDDGVATGLTLKAALHNLKAQKPKELVVAVPTIPQNTALELENEGYNVVALLEDPQFLGAVGAYYTDFRQVSDAEVVASLLDQKR